MKLLLVAALLAAAVLSIASCADSSMEENDANERSAAKIVPHASHDPTTVRHGGM